MVPRAAKSIQRRVARSVRFSEAHTSPAPGFHHRRMTSLVAEIPGYLQGRNPMSIEAVTRRLAKILQLPLDLEALRAESTEWELGISRVVEKDKALARTVRQLEEAYDNELLEHEADEG